MKFFIQRLAFLILSFILLSLSAVQAADCMQVTFFAKPIVCLKKGSGTSSLSERVLLIEKRLENIGDDLKLDPSEISITAENDDFHVNLNDYYILTLRPGDIDLDATEKFDVASQAIVDNLKEIMLEMREQKSPKTLIKGAIYTAIASLVLVIILIILSKIFVKIYALIEVKGKRIPSLKIQNWEVLNSERVIRFILAFVRISKTLLTLLALYIYIPLVLSFFPATAPMAPYIFNFIANPLKNIFQSIINFIPNFFIILVIGFFTSYTLKLIYFFFDEIERGNIEFKGFYKEWAMPSYTLIKTLVIAFSLVVIFPYIPGSDSSAFKGVSVFFGILLSIGSSSSIANIIAGVVITYMRPFQVGDIVKINDTMGKVTEKNLLITRILSNKNVDITVPNSMILGSHISNYSNHAHNGELIVSVKIACGYEVPWQKIHSLLEQAALKTQLVAPTPAPFIWHSIIEDYYMIYELNVYTFHAESMGRINSGLNQNIQDIFHENNIEMVAPAYTSIRDGNPSTLPPK